MSMKSNKFCICGGAVRVTDSKDSMNKNRVRSVPDPGVAKEGFRFWYCTTCIRAEHVHPNELPNWLRDDKSVVVGVGAVQAKAGVKRDG